MRKRSCRWTLLAVISVAAAGCGADADDTKGSGLSCNAGEVIAVDSQGNQFCKANVGVDALAAGDASVEDGVAAGADAGGGSVGPQWDTCPPKVSPGGLAHGKKCSQDSDCLYSRCVTGGFLTSYDNSISYCTKNNACTGGRSKDTAPCDVDADSPQGVFYGSAFEKSTSGGNTKRTSVSPVKVCARKCKNDAECAQWNAEMPDCILNSTDYVSTGSGVCGKNDLK
ncbi:MAG TPA: hypothetical protein DCQ06_07230 [Myxococcales bacterium]|nr:hypothetical protein [Myxococcales bacterium]